MKIERFHTYEDDESGNHNDDKFNYHLRLPLSPEEHDAIEKIKRNNTAPPEIKLARFQSEQTLRLKLSDGEIVFVSLWKDNDRFTVTKPTSEKTYSYKYVSGSDEKLPTPDGFDAEVIRFIKNTPNIDWNLKGDDGSQSSDKSDN